MKFIQIAIIQRYIESEDVTVLPEIIGLTDEGEVYRLVDAGSPEERTWKLIK